MADFCKLPGGTLMSDIHEPIKTDTFVASGESFIRWLTHKYPRWKFSFCYEPWFEGLFITVTKDNTSYKYMVDETFQINLKDVIDDMVYSCNVLNAKYKKGDR